MLLLRSETEMIVINGHGCLSDIVYYIIDRSDPIIEVRSLCSPVLTPFLCCSYDFFMLNKLNLTNADQVFREVKHRIKRCCTKSFQLQIYTVHKMDKFWQHIMYNPMQSFLISYRLIIWSTSHSILYEHNFTRNRDDDDGFAI